MRNWNHQLPERPVEPLQVLQELGLSQMFPAQMFLQQEPPAGGSQMFPAQMFPHQEPPAGGSQMFPAQMFLQQEPPSAAPGASRGAKERRKRPRSDADGTEILRDVSGVEILEDTDGVEILGDVSGSGTGPSGTGPFPNPPVHVPLARLLEVEEELICADEVDAEFECGEPAAPAVTLAVPPVMPPVVSPSMPPSMTPVMPPSMSSVAPSAMPSAKPPVMPPVIPSAMPPSMSPSMSPSMPPVIPPSMPPSMPPSAPPSMPPMMPPMAPPSMPSSMLPSMPPPMPPMMPPSMPSMMPPSMPPSAPPSMPPLTPPSMPPMMPPSVPPSMPPMMPPSMPPMAPPSMPPMAPPSMPPMMPPPMPPAVPPAVPPAASQPPAQGPGDSGWHRATAGLRAALRDGSARWHQRDFAAAAAKFSEALELCSKGFAAEDPSRSSRDEISRLSSWIQPKLVVCYLKLGQPGLALLHSHRCIAQNPSHFCNHLRQAACFRRLRRYPEAARSAMVAHFLYVLGDAARPRTSDLLQLYWQAMIQEAVREEVSFAVLYTPFEKENRAEKMKEAKKTFAEKNPGYVQHIFTDPHGIHLLPEKAESHPGQQYLLTLGFRDKEFGKAVEKFVTQNLPVLPGRKIPFSPGTGGEAETFWQNSGKRIMAAVAFVGSSRIKDTRGPCARAIEQLRGATLLSHLQNGQERAQVVAQVMAQVVAELATLPHLQRGSQEDNELLQSLTEDAVDIMAGGTGERVWTKIQKVALIEEYLRGGEERQVRTSPVGMENISWAPRPQKLLRLQNRNVLIPNPRSLVTRPKKPCVVFAKS